MAGIVFLNMADDMHIDGHKAVEALRLKYPAQRTGLLHRRRQQVEEFEVVPMYRAWKAGTPQVREMQRVRERVTGARKVMLSVHGPLKAVDHALIRNPSGGGDEKVTFRDLGGFLLELLSPKVTHNFTLVTCFAARSSDYAADHRLLGAIDWTDSFAYKLFAELCPAREVRMTARTGELSFNTQTGRSEVQTEDAIAGSLDNQAIQAELGVAQDQTWYNANIARLSLPASPHQAFVIALETAKNQATAADKLVLLRQLQLNPGLPVPHLDSARCLSYLGNLIRLTEASGRQAERPAGKSGKLVYRYLHGIGICVFAKYPTPAMVHPVPPGGPYTVPVHLLRKFARR